MRAGRIRPKVRRYKIAAAVAFALAIGFIVRDGLDDPDSGERIQRKVQVYVVPPTTVRSTP